MNSRPVCDWPTYRPIALKSRQSGHNCPDSRTETKWWFDLSLCWHLGSMRIHPKFRSHARLSSVFRQGCHILRLSPETTGGNTMEYLAGMEWDITKRIQASIGGQRTHMTSPMRIWTIWHSMSFLRSDLSWRKNHQENEIEPLISSASTMNMTRKPTTTTICHRWYRNWQDKKQRMRW